MTPARSKGAHDQAVRRRPPDRARAVAMEVLRRIDHEGAYANLVLPAVLERRRLSDRDRALVTELVYGTTRMRRACDWLIDRYLLREADAEVRTVLRLGVYQLQFTGIPDHAAVAETVALAPPRARSFVNAVLRKVAAAGPVGAEGWPSPGVRLSYPDWIVDRLSADLGASEARSALARMNEAPDVSVRADGYVQDRASQWVSEVVGARPGERVVDLCAGPGGKSTWLAGTGADVVAADLSPPRARLVADNASRTGASLVGVVAADGRRPPFPPRSADRVLVDAPCSGLGVLRRRPDARWRIEPAAIDSLVELQWALVTAALGLVRPGGVVAYSVCTLTAAETLGIDQRLASEHPDVGRLAPPGDPWKPLGAGAVLLPQRADTDGMYVLLAQAPPV